MYFSLTGFFVGAAQDSPVFYAVLTVIILALVALAMHRGLEMLLRVLKL